jgi:Tol biopolymer transport system component
VYAGFAALDDDADKPRFIETVPRRGYRFIASIEQVVPVSLAPDLPIISTISADTSKGNGHRATELPQNAIVSRSKSHPRVLAWVVALVLVAAISLVWFDTRPEPAPRILRVIPITNDGRQKFTNSPNFPAPLVSDGARLYFQETALGHTTIAQAAVTGGETELLSTPFRDAQLVGISPDHANILLADMYSASSLDLSFYSLPVVGGTAKRLGDFVAHDAAWSPGGDWLVYAKNNELDIADSNGENPRRLVSGIGIPWWPRWSPDGKKLRFTVTDTKTQTNTLWEIASDGSHLHRLLPWSSTPPNECCGDWMPDGKHFVFQAMRDDGSQIWILREGHAFLPWSTPAPVSLTTGPMQISDPLPSADGKRIYAIGAKNRGEIVRYDSRKHQFVPFLEGISASSLGFSEDAQSIFYVQYPEGALWRAKYDGTERVQLTTSPLAVMFAEWAPDGKQIAFAGSNRGGAWKIYLVSTEGGQPKQLLTEDFNEGDPSWSPDGKSLAFGRLPWKTGGQEPAQIYVMDVSSRHVTTLAGSEGLFAPHWSPDGRHLLAIKADSSAFLLFDFASQKWTTLVEGLLAHPKWSRDSNYIYALDAHVPQKTAIVRIRISDSKTQNVADLSGLRQAGMGWIGLGPDDVPLTVREAGTEEIYALEWSAH